MPTSTLSGSLVSGVADVAFLGKTLYAILAGAGCSHGLAGTDNGLLRVNKDGSTAMVADLTVVQKAHPVANPEPDDSEPDGTWYSMVVANGAFYAIEPNHGELDTISTEGAIRRVVDGSRIQGHIVPTALAFDGHNFFVGNLDTFPIKDRSSKIMKIFAARLSHDRVKRVQRHPGGWQSIRRDVSMFCKTRRAIPCPHRTPRGF